MNPTTDETPTQTTATAPEGVFPVMRELHTPLIAKYRRAPETAMIRDRAVTTDRIDPRDPMRAHVVMGSRGTDDMAVSLHVAVGGDSAIPVPGDLLCGALATCIDSTTRVVANRLGVELRQLRVTVEGDVDVRGTLMVDPHVPVGFQHFRVEVFLRAAPGSDARRVKLLTQAAEHSCVVLQTLRAGVEVDVDYDAAVAD